MARRKYADLVLRKDGIYEKMITVNGKRSVFRSKDPEEVYRKIEAFKNPPKTFSVVAEKWRDHHFATIGPGTQSCYNGAYARAIEALGDINIDEIEPQQIRAILEGMKKKGYAASTAQKQKILLNMVFNYAINELKIIKFNPVASEKLPRNMKRTVREAPEDDAVETIRNSLGCYWGLFAFFLIHTGVRKGEALAITGSDIDREKKIIRVGKNVAYEHGMPYIKDPKTEAGVREVPLLDPLLEVLPDLKPDELLFPQENGAPMSSKTYERHWRHYCKDAGFIKYEPEQRVNKNGKPYIYKKAVNTLTAHQLRHGYATILYEAGIDVQMARVLLGHKDISTTIQIYTHIRNKKRASARDMLNAHFSGNTQQVTQ